MGADLGLVSGLLGVFVLALGIIMLRLFQTSRNSGADTNKHLQDVLRDLSANQQQIVGSIKVITDTQTTSQAAYKNQYHLHCQVVL